MAESHQPPFPHSLPQQQQQGMAPWYPVPPYPYHGQQQQPPPPPQQHMQWQAPPPTDQAFGYSQPLPYPPQGDYYAQQAHQYPLPPQPCPPQFTYMYGQQDQVWQPNNNWGYQQWPQHGQNVSLSQEEVWAAKARAWAASKAVQNETNQVQPGQIAHPGYHDYLQQQDSEMLHPLDQQYTLQPPGQEAGGASIHEQITNQVHSIVSKTLDQPLQEMQDISSLELGFPQKAVSVGQSQSVDLKAAPSSYPQDTSQSYGLDNITAAPPGAERLDIRLQQAPLPPSAAPGFPQQQTHLLPQSQASPHVSQSRYNYTEEPPTAGYELHQQQQLPPNFQQQQQQPQQQYQPLNTIDGLETEFGLSSPSLQNWATLGGPGMPFPPAMAVGNSQFDPLNGAHQIPVPIFGRPHGSQQGPGFPSSGPFVVGASPTLGPGPGAPARPMFIPDGFVERPKKAAVPSWLREELMKKKAAGLAGNSTGMLLSDESNRVNGGDPAIHLNQRLGISDKLRRSSPGLSDQDNDQEEEVEAARNAAINQELKRLLTEVLLKVTGDLFEEIAQEILDEENDETFPVRPPEQETASTPISSSPPASVPTVPARVLVTSLKSHGASDAVDRQSEGSGTAGDVLGLGDYASDDEDAGLKDRQKSVSDVGERTERRHQEFRDTVGLKMDVEQSYLERKVQSREMVEDHEGNKDESISLDLSSKLHSVQGDNDKGVERDRRRHQEAGKKRSQEQHARSPETAQVSSKENHVAVRNGDLDASISQDNLSMSKEEHRRASADGLKQSHSDLTEAVPDTSGRNLSKEKSIVGSKGDTQGRDQHKSKVDLKERPALGKETVAAVNKPLVGHVEKPSIREMGSSKHRESLNIHRSSDLSGKEKKREERNKDSDRKKGPEAIRNERGSDVSERDSSRDRRKEKLREKTKLREKEHERDRRKSDRKESDRKDRESRSKRADAMEKKNRHRSSSSSSRHTGNRSSSCSSYNSRGRLHTRRSSRNQSSVSSPGRSKKRRVSRSRSRSPHAKHSHRRNVSSPSHDKSRRSASKSPVHRRRHS